MMKLAEIRETDRDGGVKPGSVYLWQRKLLSMYKQESSLVISQCSETDHGH